MEGIGCGGSTVNCQYWVPSVSAVHYSHEHFVLSSPSWNEDPYLMPRKLLQASNSDANQSLDSCVARPAAQSGAECSRECFACLKAAHGVSALPPRFAEADRAGNTSVPSSLTHIGFRHLC